MMSFAEFKEVIKNEVSKRLPEEYADYKYDFTTINKTGCSYEALMIGPKTGSSCVPALNLTEAYMLYDGTNMDEIVDKLVKVRLNAKINIGFNKDDILKFECVRDRIYPKLVNTVTNADYLEDKVVKKCNDLSVVYVISLFECADRSAEIAITTDLAEQYGVSTDDLNEIAIANLDKTDPMLCTIPSVLLHDGTNLWRKVANGEKLDVEIPFFILTNSTKHRGASQVLRDSVMNAIAKDLGDVYVIPSSVDEVIIIPKSECNDTEVLAGMIRDVNVSSVAPADRLSDNLYQWTVANGFELV